MLIPLSIESNDEKNVFSKTQDGGHIGSNPNVIVFLYML